MNEKVVMATVLGVIALIGISSMIQLNAFTGQAAKYDYRDCVCKIQLKNYQGQIITPKPIETKLRMHMQGQNCQNVCENYYRSPYMSVIGVPGSLA